MDKSYRIIRALEILKKEQSRTMLGDMSKRYDPFRILISTILSARSKDEVTYPICENLFEKYPTAEKLAKARKKEVIKIIKQIGFYNRKAGYIIDTAKGVISEYRGKVPSTMEELKTFPGVGNKVAGCVMVYAHGLDEIPIDVHVAVVSHRVGLTKNKNPDKIMEDLKRITPRKYWMLVNDLFVWHGKEACDTRKPRCWKCKIIKLCLYKNKNLKK
ncbi:MAG: endonuclease III [Nanoarchaeota archaeon]|nr:endonuclease III [Nanoarchaeota archaeon]